MILYVESASPSTARDQRSDNDIQLAIWLERRLQSEMQLAVRVHVSKEQVQLFGQVGSWYLKQQAQELVREAAPEYRIRNEIRVVECGI